jgi:hypothetical protein
LLKQPAEKEDASCSSGCKSKSEIVGKAFRLLHISQNCNFCRLFGGEKRILAAKIVSSVLALLMLSSNTYTMK